MSSDVLENRLFKVATEAAIRSLSMPDSGRMGQVRRLSRDQRGRRTRWRQLNGDGPRFRSAQLRVASHLNALARRVGNRSTIGPR